MRGFGDVVGFIPDPIARVRSIVSHDTLLHRAVRPIVKRLGPTWVRPNHITVARFLGALLAAAAFAVGTVDWVLLGAISFTIAAVLDRADGELARLTQHFSPQGHRLDLVADWGADALAFLALGYGARDGWMGWWSILFGILAAAGITALFWQLNGRDAKHGAPRTRHAFDPDDAIFALPILICAVGVTPVLLVSGIVTPLAAVALVTCSFAVRAKPLFRSNAARIGHKV